MSIDQLSVATCTVVDEASSQRVTMPVSGWVTRTVGDSGDTRQLAGTVAAHTFRAAGAGLAARHNTLFVHRTAAAAVGAHDG